MKKTDVPYWITRSMGILAGLLLGSLSVWVSLMPLRFGKPFLWGRFVLGASYICLLLIPHRWCAASQVRFVSMFLGLLILSSLQFSPATFEAILPPLIALEISRGRIRMKDDIWTMADGRPQAADV